MQSGIETRSEEIITPTELPQDTQPLAVAESKEYRFGVRAAFQIATVQLAGICFLSLLYYNYIMIKGYTAPFFWALIFSVILRKLKNYLLVLLLPLKEIETQNTTFLSRIFYKLKYLWFELFKKPITLCLLFSLCGKSLCSEYFKKK